MTADTIGEMARIELDLMRHDRWGLEWEARHLRRFVQLVAAGALGANADDEAKARAWALASFARLLREDAAVEAEKKTADEKILGLTPLTSE